jgi:hypothetical protein
MSAVHITDPVGLWWAAFDNGEVWPVEVLHITPFGTRVRSTHEAAPQGEFTFHNSRVYDNDFNHPRRRRDGSGHRST